MAACDPQLWEFIRSIEPTPTQKNGASRSHSCLRDILCTGQMASRIANHYLSGSYARDTAIHPLDDVDIIFAINPSYWPNSFSILFGSSRFPAPSAVLESFAKAIRYRYPKSSVFSQRRSVRLQLYHLDIDVVPAITDSGNAEFVWIPDRETNGWILSSPKRHSENATRINKSQFNRFKPLVKLLKFWNGNLPGTARLKSFAIETLAVRIFDNFEFETLQEGLRYFFDFVAFASGMTTELRWPSNFGVSLRWLHCSIPDAANTGSNIVKGLEDERRRRFVESAIRSRDRMTESLDTSSVQTACRRVSQALRI